MKVTFLRTSSILFLCCGLALLFVSTANAGIIYYFGDSTGDGTLVNHIVNDLGHTVIQVDPDNTASNYAAAVAANADVIVISGSIVSSRASGRGFHTSEIPILNFEPASYDNFGWTGNTSGTDYGDTAAYQEYLQIEDPSHPIADGFSAGLLSVITPDEYGHFSFGVPSQDADIVATFQSEGEVGDGAAVIFVYEEGDALVQATGDDSNVTTANARYIGAFLNAYAPPIEDQYGQMNANGVKLFDQMLGYALEASEVPEPSSIVLLSLGMAMLLACRIRRGC